MPDGASDRPKRRERVFFILMLLLPLLFFVLLEGGLRLAGYGASYPLFVPVEGFDGYLYQNKDVARRYFSQQAEVPTGLTDAFQTTKDPSTFRVFVQGGSSAAGYPYYYGGAFSRMLEQRLKQTYPDRDIEVINTALAAVNSYTLLDFADEILAHQPDAVLIYAGHNEYYGALGVGSTESIGPVPHLVNLYLRLQDWRMVQALRGLLSAGVGLLQGGEAQGGVTLMERMVAEQAIPYGSPLYRQGLAQFRHNMSRLLARYAEAGIPVYLGTLASNVRDQPPFISRPRPDVPPAFQQHLDAAQTALRSGKSAPGREALVQALTLDTLAALPYFLLGRLEEEQGQYGQARAAYLRAKDRDQLRFRAPEDINTLIRWLSDTHGATVVDTQAALMEASPHGLIGQSLMLEHLHPNIEGQFLMADAFYTALRAHPRLGTNAPSVPRDDARREVLLTAVDSLVATYRIRVLMGSWPFQPPGVVNHGMDAYEPADDIQRIAYDLYEGRLPWYDATEQLYTHYTSHGQHLHALRVALAQVQEYPFLPGPYAAAAQALLNQRRFREALVYFLAADDLEPSPGVQLMVGNLYAALGDRNNALAYFDRSASHPNLEPDLLIRLAAGYAQAGRPARAVALLDQLLRQQPDHGAALSLRTQILSQAPVER